MALAILTFGPGAISLDRLIGLDGQGNARKASLAIGPGRFRDRANGSR
jgi:hypothetical protein